MRTSGDPLTRLMQGMLYGVSPNDPATFAVALLLTGAVAMAASYLPARRAGRLDPASALSAGEPPRIRQLPPGRTTVRPVGERFRMHALD